MSVYNERLQRLAQRAAELLENADELEERRRDLAYLTVLAAHFDYQVKNGGFAQLIHNMGSERLEDLDGMLRAVDAPVALDFYVRAVTRCTERLDDYHQLLADFAAPTQLAVELTGISVEYLRGDVGFDAEIAPFLEVADAL
ncbi:DMP19 family protein [Nocardia harenae]|uniref:DMP19 family protein n=1 Tax=Nocardia harenae TaxID=358707 RepID=UPI000831B316|nr:hypothetical protein [Nocardia harenae]